MRVAEILSRAFPPVNFTGWQLVQIVRRMGQMLFQPLLVLRLRHFKGVAGTTTNDQVSVIKDGVVIMPVGKLSSESRR